MSVVITSPYSLDQGDLIQVRVSASNSYGSGTASPVNSEGAQVRVIPEAPNIPRRAAETSTGQIEVEWDLLSAPNNGDSEIISYHLVWDAGTGTTTVALVGLVSDYTLGSYTATTGVQMGDPYLFKVRARNVYGWGPYSPEVEIVASDVPSQMQVATTSIEGTAARISWTAPSSNGEALSSYEVLVLHSDGTTFSEEAVSCSGSDSTIITTRSCDIPLDTLRNAPFSLVRGDLVQAKVRAANAQGFGPYSQVNVEGGLVETEPGQVQGLTFEEGSSSVTQITLSWQPLSTDSETGGAPILGYEIYSAEEAESPTWSGPTQVTAVELQYTATGLTGGVTYLFKVRATNLHGDGEFSTSLSALAAQEPDQPAAPTTTQVATGVSVSWIAPAANHLAVEEYEVTIADSGGTFSADSSLCDGSSASVVADLYCIIPMASLTAAPYQLAVDTVIACKVRARNARGWGAYSDANTEGVKAQTVPATMAAPFTDPAQTGEDQLYVEWSALTTTSETGGSAVTSYNL